MRKPIRSFWSVGAFVANGEPTFVRKIARHSCRRSRTSASIPTCKKLLSCPTAANVSRSVRVDVGYSGEPPFGQ